MKTRTATSNARRTLLRKGRDLLQSVAKGRSRGRGKPADVMDLLAADERNLLASIHLALERIERGIFGSCEACSERIPEERLSEQPWKLRCQDCEGNAADADADVTGRLGPESASELAQEH
jgi:hypothetical protein